MTASCPQKCSSLVAPAVSRNLDDKNCRPFSDCFFVLFCFVLFSLSTLSRISFQYWNIRYCSSPGGDSVHILSPAHAVRRLLLPGKSGGRKKRKNLIGPCENLIDRMFGPFHTSLPATHSVLSLEDAQQPPGAPQVFQVTQVETQHPPRWRVRLRRVVTTYLVCWANPGTLVKMFMSARRGNKKGP